MHRYPHLIGGFEQFDRYDILIYRFKKPSYWFDYGNITEEMP